MAERERFPGGPIMKLLDRYIIRQFISTSLFSLLSVLVVFIVIDAMEKLDDFIDHQAGTVVILQYYLYFIPEIIKLISPVALLLGSLFVTARLSTQNELTAMRSAGMSLYRFMIPYTGVALLACGLLVYFNGWVVPAANARKFAIERNNLQKDVINASGANIFVQDSPTRILSIGFYNDLAKTATRVSIQDFDSTDPTRMVGRIDAMSMAWDSSAHRWVLSNGTKRWFSANKESFETFVMRPTDKMHFDPEDLRKKQEKPDEMDYNSLKNFIDGQRRAGQDVAQWMVEFYGKISYPFAAVIVVLFGVPFASMKRRGGTGVQLGISLLICFIYLIVMKVSQVFGFNGDIDPLLTAWLANIAFFLGAVFVMVKVRS
jgi:lipopolysaccharide export system permease protein